MTITAPAAGASVANSTQVTVTGTASDVGGRVAGVEVSTNDGDTWHPATGTASWSYTYDQKGMGTTQIRVRAADDSANLGAVVARSVDVQCPCSIFGTEVPPTPAAARRGRTRARPALQPDGGRLPHRGAVLQGDRQRRHPPGHALGTRRRPARHRHVHQRDRDRLADAEVHPSGPGLGRSDLHGVLHRTAGPLRAGQRGLLRRAQARAAAQGGRRVRCHPGRRLRLARRLPDQQLPQLQLLRRRHLHHRRRLAARCDQPVAARRLEQRRAVHLGQGDVHQAPRRQVRQGSPSRTSSATPSPARRRTTPRRAPSPSPRRSRSTASSPTPRP